MKRLVLSLLVMVLLNLSTIPVKANPLGVSVNGNQFNSFSQTGLRDSLPNITHFKMFPSVVKTDLNLDFQLTNGEFITIKVYDVNGIEVKELFSENLYPGLQCFHFNMESLENGTYRLIISGKSGNRSEKFYVNK